MKIRQTILNSKYYLLSNYPIIDLDESLEEFIHRQEYVHDIIMAHTLLNEEVDWDNLNHSDNYLHR